MARNINRKKKVLSAEIQNSLSAQKIRKYYEKPKYDRNVIIQIK